ncbi:MAG TPA: hypothetical protein VGC54_06935 [Planctomycetota bacterium]
MIQIAAGQAIGPYVVQAFLGRGAFAEVFLATDSEGRRFALKIGDKSGGGRYLKRFDEVTEERDPGRVSPDEAPAEALFLDPHDGARAELLDTREVDELLLGEMELLRAADRAGVVGLHDVVEEKGRPVLVLDFVPGCTMRERIRAGRGVKLVWVVEAARTIENLVDAGIWRCHGDVKPENLMITEGEKVVVIDPASSTERADEIIATPAYNPFLRRDSKGDAQSFAILLYEILCGALPFDETPWPLAGTDPSLFSVDERRLHRSFYLGYPRPRELNPRTPTEIERVIYRALCDENYRLADLRQDLEDFLLRV